MRKRPCSYCRRWFMPDVRVGARQRACSTPACQDARRVDTQAEWRAANPTYGAKRRIEARAAAAERAEVEARAPPPPPRLPGALARLPWDVAQDQFGHEGAEFIGVFGRLLLLEAKDQTRVQVADSAGDFPKVLRRGRKTSSGA